MVQNFEAWYKEVRAVHGGRNRKEVHERRLTKKRTRLHRHVLQMPVVTRSYLTLAFLTTVGCAMDLISPFSLYFNVGRVFHKYEVWRIFTNFFFFGTLGLDFVFHMFFLSRYCRLLEEGSFRGRTADFFFMLVFGGFLMLAVAPFANVHFLGSSLTFMMVYVWGRRNRYVNMSFLGLFNFTAPYLPWVLLVFSMLLGSSPTIDLLGMAAGHIYYFLEDVYPSMTGRRFLHTPAVIKAMFPGDDIHYTTARHPLREEVEHQEAHPHQD